MISSINQVEFIEEGHRYLVRGVERPGVTRVLKDLKLTPPYPEDKGWLGFGHAVHYCLSLLVQGKLRTEGVGVYPGTVYAGAEQPLWSYLAGAHRKFDELRIRPIAVEQRVYHPEGYCGTTDLVCTMNGDPQEWAIDYKNSTSSPAPCTALQLAAYDLACPGPQCGKRKRAALKLEPDRARLIEYPDPYDYQAWLGAFRLWKWENK